MIKELTEAQKAKFPEYVSKWMEFGNAPVAADFYSPEIIDEIRKTVVGMYAVAGLSLLPENVHIAESPYHAPFMVSALIIGKPGTPRSPVKSKMRNLGICEQYLNGFSNPKAIISDTKKVLSSRYWGRITAGFYAFLSFFANETDLKNSVFKEHGEELRLGINFSALCYDGFFMADFAVVSKCPVEVSTKTRKWADGATIEV